MKNKLHMLILLGLVCAGLSYEFEHPLMPLAYGAVGVLCLLFRREKRVLPRYLEELLFFGAILAAYHFGRHYGPNRLIFIANALVVYQVFRLLWPTNVREQKFSLAICIVHLAVGSLVVVDWKFVLILALAIYLIPGAMCQIESGKYRRGVPGGQPIPQSKLQLAALALLMIFFFLAFPRVGVMQQFSMAGLGMAGRLDRRLDLTRTAGGSSDRLIFRVEGRNMGYLRTHCLDQFDGRYWTASQWLAHRDPSRTLDEPISTKLSYRSVKVVASNLLDTALPTDGRVRRLELPLYQHFYVADHGGVRTARAYRYNLTYKYWTSFEHTPQPFRRRSHYYRFLDLSRFTPSDRLRQWLDNVIAGEADPVQIARKLEAHFYANEFTYELGVPRLNRLAPLDDFIFNEKRGHCERYAAALAVLLRMKNIPSRVVLGFVPQEYNEFGGFYNIRLKHAHAWTEAWFPGQGWLELDATPAAARALERRNLAFTLYEWLEYTWYSKVVEFDVHDQNQLLDLVTRNTSLAAGWLWRHISALLGVFFLAALILLLTRLNWRAFLARRRTPTRQQTVSEAKHFYGRMLRLLAKRRYRRQRSQTPHEFLGRLEAETHPELEAVRFVTEEFCGIRYGNAQMTTEARARIQQAISRIAACRTRRTE